MIVLRDIYKEYTRGKEAIPALNGINLEVSRGEIYGIIGHSGAGKSTLIRTINLLERPTSGQVWVGDVELTALSRGKLQAARRGIGMIFQHFNLLSSATVAENVAFPLQLAGRPKAEIRRKVEELLKLVGLEAFGGSYPSQLSGGQKQRVGIARALASDPQVLLCDEATSALDPQTTNSILELLLDINRKLQLTIVLITHEMQVIRSICDRVAVIHNGSIVEEGPVTKVFLRPRHEVTRDFIEQVSEKTDLPAYTSALASEEYRSIIKVSFLGEQTYQPILFETVSETGCTFAILHGTISTMKHTPYGQLVVELAGKEDKVRRTVEILQSRGVEVEAEVARV